MKQKEIDFSKISEEILMAAAATVDEASQVTMYRVRGSYQYAVRFRREDADEVDFLHELFGGYRYEQDKDGKKFYWLNLQQGRCIEFLRVVYPYLVVKKPQADIIFAICARIKANNRSRIKPEDSAAREELLEQLRKLNKDDMRQRNIQEQVGG